MKFQGRFWQWFKNGLTIMLALSFVFAFTGRFYTPSDTLPKNTRLPQFKLHKLQEKPATMTAKDLQGRGVMLHFWASWCNACKRGMPSIEALHKRFSGEHFQVLGVTGEENPQAALSYLKKRGYRFPNIWDQGGKLGSRFKVRSIPFTVFMGPDGKLVGDMTGIVSESEGAERIEAMLSKAPSSAPASYDNDESPEVRVE